uniref:Endonuclease/exonuclease/phosphatase domain-containing protein n=1 Tax=Octopus bimaculoides TaxID=37653 RepID=A0A0L8H866_OCTBM
MGQHGMSQITNNGKCLINISEESNLVIGGTHFKHKNIHKLTWTSPGGKTKSQIDHIIINRRSDHYLLIAKLKLKLNKSCTRTTRNQRLDVTKSNDYTIKKQFQCITNQ